MTDPTDKRPFSYVKHLREVRDRINKELEHMTPDEVAQWRQSREYKNPNLRRLMSRARPPKPRRSQHGTARALGLLPYPKYRPSGVEWLGEVPEHWEVKPIKHATHRPVGGTWGDDPGTSNKGDCLVCIRVADFDRSTRVVSDNASTLRAVEPSHRRRRLLLPGDLLIEKSGGGDRQPVGFVAIFENTAQKAVCSNFVARLSVKKALVPRFWMYCHMVLYENELNRLAIKQTTGIQNLDLRIYLDTLFCYPPFQEQICIVEYLRRKTAKIDALIRQKEALVEGLEEYRTALISRTVTHGLPPNEARKAGLDPHPKLKPSGLEWLGEVPEHWRKKRVKDLFDKMERPVRECDDVVTCFRDGNVTLRKNRREKGFTESIKEAGYQGIRKGDLVVHTMDAFAGAVGVSDSDGKGTPVYVVCRARPHANAPFFAYLIREMARRGWIQALTRGVRERSSDFRYRELGVQWVAVPPLDEQEAIVSYLDRETTKIDRVTDLARQDIDLLREYRTRLISDVVTGKVDVRGIGGADMEATA